MAETVYPGPDDVAREMADSAEALGDMCRIESIGKSVEGRDILAARVTDPDVPDDQKQHCLVIAGQHGAEESGRLGALALLQWLASHDADAEDTRRKQLVVIVPAVNPDGAQVDRSANSNGVNLNRQFDIDAESREPEAEAVMKLAEELIPDCVVDMHGLTGIGCDDMILIGGCKPYTEDVRIHQELAARMVAGAEDAGYTMTAHPSDWSGWNLDKPNCFVGHCYWRYHPITFLTEGDEALRIPEMMAAAGRERVKPLIVAGNFRHPWAADEGYPNGMLGGVVNLSVRACGDTAGARRRSRTETWRAIGRIPKLGRGKRGDSRETIAFELTAGDPLQEGFSLARRYAGRPDFTSVAFDEVQIDRGKSGYAWKTWTDKASTFVQLLAPTLEPGEHSCEICWEGRD